MPLETALVLPYARDFCIRPMVADIGPCNSMSATMRMCHRDTIERAACYFDLHLERVTQVRGPCQMSLVAMA
jgi:hypothetical protein